MPCAFFSAILRSSWANRYGGMRSRRLLDLIQLLRELVAEGSFVDRARPAGEVNVQVLADVDLEIAAVEMDRDRAVAAAQRERHRGAGRAGARRQRLPHAALEDASGDLALGVAPPERHVRAVGEQLVRLDRRADEAEVDLLEAVAHLDRALRVADRDVLEAELPAGDAEGSDAIVAAAREVLRSQLCATHVHAAAVRARDRRPDLAGGGLDRERVGVGPAALAEVH